MLKKLLALLVFLMIIGLFTLLGMPSTGCSPDELARWSNDHPSLKSTTQAVERIEEKVDSAANKTKAIVDTGEKVAEGAAGIGIPCAGGLAVVLSGISGIIGVWAQRRRGTLPALSALTQVVQSVETAFPNKTPEQKAALAAVQDSATKNLVTKIKGT